MRRRDPERQARRDDGPPDHAAALALLDAGWDWVEVGRRVGRSPHTIKQWQRGETPIPGGRRRAAGIQARMVACGACGHWFAYRYEGNFPQKSAVAVDWLCPTCFAAWIVWSARVTPAPASDDEEGDAND